MRYLIGDIRDKQRLDFATQGVDFLVHAAALKHVPAAEYNPFEAVKTNIIGSQNVIESSIHNNVCKTIALSTDKAAAPINVYGATKLTADKLFLSANNYSGPDSSFAVVRYGNVMGSRGSVIPLFLEHRDRETLSITDPEMTRFNITLKQGVDFVINCFQAMRRGELFVPKIPSYRILDLAEAIAPNAKINITGIRPGEKLHEEMVTAGDSGCTIEYHDRYIILPQSEFYRWDRQSYNSEVTDGSGTLVRHGFIYRSDTNTDFLPVERLRELIIESVPGGGVLKSNSTF